MKRIAILSLMMLAVSRIAAGQVLVQHREPASFDPCLNVRTSAIVVLPKNQTLYLCQERKAIQSFPVSLGPGGVGKNRQGDGKTPLGVYELSPNQSPNYGTTLFIRYPTLKQKLKGYTGGEILIHGPSFNMADDFDKLKKFILRKEGPERGADTFVTVLEQVDRYGWTAANWTAGCIAVGTTEELAEIIAFAKGKRLRIAITDSPNTLTSAIESNQPN